ncbi:MAG: 2-iminoacetate synthase ThiH [Flavobacteriales bacterium]|nr:2-iminoacetate synthase ThiH [Flavobacteriales bacterium]
MSFINTFQSYNWPDQKRTILEKTHQDVEFALSKHKLSLEDFKALVSPAAEPYLEQLAFRSQRLTQERFGKTIQMYIPMYLSNECNNICTYCGFSLDVKMDRKTLNQKEILDEIKILKAYGYDHVLLVTGESNQKVGIDYFLDVLPLFKDHFSNISMEVQPLDQKEYERLREAGVHSILVYQETYNQSKYKEFHPKGRKSNFEYRLETPDRLGRSGMHKIGLGALFGLSDWRTDAFFTALHLSYLEKKYWRTKYSVSFPRLRPCAGMNAVGEMMTDRQLVQLICAFRLFNQELELSMSTRESENFRNNIINLGITSISADSKTDPGGYSSPSKNLEQFEIDDKRSTKHFVEIIKGAGYEPVWKDWDSILS